MEQIIGVESNAISCDGCVSRRDFLARVAVIAGTMAVAAACGAAGGDVTGVGTLQGPLTIKVSDYAALATVGQPVEVRDANGRGTGVAAVRTGASSFIALGMSCTHQGTKVNITGNSFTCPNHGAQFSNTGAVTRGPAGVPLYRYGVAYDATAQTLTIS